MHSQAAPLGWSRAYIRWARTRQSGFGFHGIARIYQLWNVGKGVEGILENFAPRLKHTAVARLFPFNAAFASRARRTAARARARGERRE